MPLPGGATDKIGNRYEGRWTVHCMIDVMDEKADAIRLEKPGEDAFEFFVRKNNNLECHQVKRQRSGRGRWTLKALEDVQVQVLSDFWKSLRNSNVNCVFVSTQDADELGELAQRARDALSWIEFERDFLNKGLGGHFNTLRENWANCSEIHAFEALKRVRVETVGESFLVDAVDNRLATLVEGDPKTIRLELAELALERIHHELTAHDIWDYLLRERRYRRRQWGKDPHVLAAVDSVNNSYIFSLGNTQAIAGEIIPRDEAQAAFEQLIEQKQSTLLLGEAGVGKSGVMLQVVEKLQNKGFPIIAFRIDRLEATLLPDNLGQKLDLPASPAIVLANIAQNRDCVLVIDQLDAVSLASGRNPQFFDCIVEIIKQAQAHSNIRLLLACRKFDLENDNRLKRLCDEKNGVAKALIINRLSHSIVRDVIFKLGLDKTRLTQNQLNLLSIPLHLSLLAEIAEDSRVDALSFQTAKELYDHFWKYKQHKLRERLALSVQWTQVIDSLCDYMSNQQKQTLSAPERVVDEFADDANAMASEHILIWQNKRISFFHESFFDYAFARRFASRGQELLSFLRSSEQHLFRRAQVRQILIHQREEDFDYYLENLRELLTSSDIRFHLKKVVFALLATLDNPTEEEWEIIYKLIGDESNALTREVWILLNSCIRWFELLDGLGIIEQWLRDESEERIDRTVTLLSFMQKQIPDRVAELLEPFVGASEVWSQRFIRLIAFAEFGVGRRFFDLFLNLIYIGILDCQIEDENIRREFWSYIYGLPKQNLEWACEAISHFLNRRLNISLASGFSNPFDENSGAFPYSPYYKKALIESADKTPFIFVENVLPFMLRVMDLTAVKQGNPPWKDAVWGFRIYGDDYGIDNLLLNKMESALSNLAANHAEDFANISKQYLRHSNFETIQYLLVRAYTANGKSFADKAIDYLCEKPARLKTGGDLFRNSTISNEPYWATYQLLKATTTFCSEEQIIKLQAVILDYYTDEEKTAIGLSYRGYPQLVLLNAMAPFRRTEAANRRLKEWERKFNDSQLLERLENIEPSDLMASLVGSPIPESASEKMTDEQWLNAMACYNQNEPKSFFQRNGEFLGGSGELSHILERQVKAEPERFAELIRKFPDNTHPHYFNAVLCGIADVGIDVETALRVCQRCHQLPNRPCGGSICWLFKKLPKLPWYQEAFDIVIWYALNDPDPVAELQHTNQSHDIHSKGINSTRGSAVNAIAALIFAGKNRVSYFQEALQQIVKDPSVAVRSCAVEALTATLNYDRNLAVTLFQKLYEIEEDSLLGIQRVEYFFYHALPTHLRALAPILERMIMSELLEVIKIGTRQACLVSLCNEEARWLTELCLSGTETHRSAACEIFVKHLRKASFREFCENALIQLFHDSDSTIRYQASRCFFLFEGEELGEYVSLIEVFVDSPAFDNATDLFHALDKTSAKLPDVTFRVCDRFLQNLTSDNPQVRSRTVFAGEVSKLLVRLYSQSKNKNLQTRCLDLVDCMVEIGVYGLNEVLQEFER